MDVRARRAAENESLFRRINERVEELAGGHDVLPILCECADAACTERLSVPRDEYERTRAHAERFIVTPGHVVPDLEAVVEARPGWVVVAKSGEAAELVRDDDPRSE